jgi:hypothetical protein
VDGIAHYSTHHHGRPTRSRRVPRIWTRSGDSTAFGGHPSVVRIREHPPPLIVGPLAWWIRFVRVFFVVPLARIKAERGTGLPVLYSSTTVVDGWCCSWWNSFCTVPLKVLLLVDTASPQVTQLRALNGSAPEPFSDCRGEATNHRMPTRMATQSKIHFQ